MPLPDVGFPPCIHANSSRWAGPWLTDDGARMLVGIGELYSASTLTATGGTLQQGSDPYLHIQAAAHSTAAHRIVAALHVWDGTGDLRIYDDAAAPVLKETRFGPGIVVGGSAWGTPRAVFWRQAGATFYVVLRTGDRFGIEGYAYP